MESEGFFELQKRLKLPPAQRFKDELTRRNTFKKGYIVWLQECTSDGEINRLRDIKPLPIRPSDIGPSAQRAAEIDACARTVIENVSLLSLSPLRLSLYLSLFQISDWKDPQIGRRHSGVPRQMFLLYHLHLNK